MTTSTIWRRSRRLVNTDPQRRCYDGCHFSSELVWTDWEVLESGVPADKVADRMEFWRDLNKIAVDGRGERALCEFKAEPEKAE